MSDATPAPFKVSGFVFDLLTVTKSPREGGGFTVTIEMENVSSVAFTVHHDLDLNDESTAMGLIAAWMGARKGLREYYGGPL